MILSSIKEPLMACTALLLSEPTQPLWPGLAHEFDFTEGRCGPQGRRLLPGSHCGCVIKLFWPSVSDGHTRDLDRTLGPDKKRRKLLKVSVRGQV